MLFNHQQQQQQHELQHLKTHVLSECQLDSSSMNPLLQNPITSSSSTKGPVKKRSYRTALGVGEIVEVEGGHIIRSTGRKDRHSKVCTAKGPRDRRVRLSANTAIQFYDVQDRLGFDRPSKALDWLINKAKPAIDDLHQLPPWKPSLDNSGAIADTIKSFFPLNAAVSEPQFEPYPNNHNNNLKLSLQSFPDPMLIGFDNPSSEWGGGFMAEQQPLLFHHHQRGPLQSSSNTPTSVRAWIGADDYSIAASSIHDFHQAYNTSSASGFSGYCFPARIQGHDEEEEEEEHAGILNNPPCFASSPSRH